jgi:hypothetical protein
MNEEILHNLADTEEKIIYHGSFIKYAQRTLTVT